MHVNALDRLVLTCAMDGVRTHCLDTRADPCPLNWCGF
jgi:hypothetical protein